MSIDTIQRDLEKIKLDFGNLQSLINSTHDKAIGDINTLIEESKKKEELLQDKLHKKDTLVNTQKELQAKLQGLEKEIEEKNTSIKETTALIDDKTKALRELETKLDAARKQEIELKTEVTYLSDQVKEHKDKHQALQNEKSAEDQKYHDQIDSLLNETNKIKAQNESLVRQLKALQYLIKKQHVSIPEVNVIKTLSQPGVNNAVILQKSTGLSEQAINRILQGLNSRGLIEYNSASGEFKVTGNLEL